MGRGWSKRELYLFTPFISAFFFFFEIERVSPYTLIV